MPSYVVNPGTYYDEPVNIFVHLRIILQQSRNCHYNVLAMYEIPKAKVVIVETTTQR